MDADVSHLIILHISRRRAAHMTTVIWGIGFAKNVGREGGIAPLTIAESVGQCLLRLSRDDTAD